MREKLEDKLNDLESNLEKWEKEEPQCDLGISLKMKVITQLNESIDSVNGLILLEKQKYVGV